MSERALARVLVAVASLTAFAPVLAAGFSIWDDPAIIIENPLIRGLSMPHLRAMATGSISGIPMPLTFLSLAVDRSLWGEFPGGFHLTNLLLHALAALLFHELCRLLFRRLGTAQPERAAALAALFFAVHPLRVEAVAWASERKGLLSGVLAAAALLLRLRGHGSPRPLRWDAAALAAYALSLAAKPNALTFPLALLVVERGLLRRRVSWTGYAPYFALSGAAFAATMLASRAAGSLAHSPLRGAAWSSGQALYGLFFYPLKTLWPSRLALYYPPQPWFPSWSWTHAALAGGLAGAAWALRAPAARPLAAALGNYALLALPMLGFVQLGVPLSAADRFSYLPGMALAAPIGAFFSRGRARQGTALLWLLALGVLSWRRSEQWAEPLTLWSDSARARPNAYALANEGGLLAREGRHEEAIARLRASLDRARRDSLPHETLGAELAALGRGAEAEAAWREGLEAAPSPRLHALLGAALARRGRAAEGAALLERAIAAAPERADWRADLGDAYAAAGRAQDAKRAYEAALERDPGQGRALVDLGLLAQAGGRGAEARALFLRALRSPAERARAQHDLGVLALAGGRTQEAERRFREAARLEPGFGAPRVNLGNFLARSGRLREAALQYRAVKEKDRAWKEARSNLAAVEAALRRR